MPNFNYFLNTTMESRQTSSASTHNIHQNNGNFNQVDLHQMILIMSQKINNLENERKENQELKGKVTQMNRAIIYMNNQMAQEKRQTNSKLFQLNNKIGQQNNEIIYLNGIVAQQRNKIIYLNNKVNQQNNQINQQNNKINQMEENFRNERILSEIKYEKRFKYIENSILNLEDNYSIINKEISSFKIIEDMINSILILLKVIIKDIEALYEKQNVNEKDFEEINEKINRIESKVAKFSIIINDNYLSNFNVVFAEIEKVIKDLDKIKIKFNIEIKYLEKEIVELKRKYKELQKILISRKIIKIIIKYIIIYCIKYFTMEDNSCKLNDLTIKYSQLNSNKVKEIINSLIVKNRQLNKTIHLEGGIDKIIELLNEYGNKITFSDLINIIDFDHKTRKYIKKIMEITNISNLNIYYDIIGADPELKEMLLYLQEKINVCK